ncbi:putative acyltransferase [Gordonia araii NBRC 100433]|uniref:Putative acyltransferase n=2 Tax=Gordonia araii TaxID=263909 RepID=G7H3Q4_9ACTN|nr:putative acyltransferase [Gordonia araii NBRC 100433]
MVIDKPESSAPGARWDPAWVARVLPLLRTIAKSYFRSEVRGMDKVPDGGVLLVSNHSGGLMAYDVPLLAVAFAEEFGDDEWYPGGHVAHVFSGTVRELTDQFLSERP